MELDIVGDGGGEPPREALGVPELGLGAIGLIWGVDLDPADLALAADFVDAASERSFPTEVSMLDNDARGLSDFDPPGIFDLMVPRNEREDSLVSDLVKDG